MSDNPSRLGNVQALIDSFQEEVDAYNFSTAGTYNSGREPYLYCINLDRADALHTGIDLYPIIYHGWISKTNGENRKPASFIQFSDKECADKYCGVSLDDPSFLPSYFPSSIYDETISQVFVCVRPVEGFLDLTISSAPVFGNPAIMTMRRIKELVQVFLAMVKHDVCNSLWNSAGCYLLCNGKIKVIVNEFKADYNDADWEIRIAKNLMELAYGLYNFFLNPQIDWLLRDSFLGFFDASNKIDNDLRKRIKRILTHPFLMEDPWEILQLAYKAFKSFDVIPPQTPGYKYSNLHFAITNGSFINSINTGRFTDDPGSYLWLFYAPLILPFEIVYHNHSYNHSDGLSFSLFVRNIINLNGLAPYVTHREMEMIFPRFFHRLHEFT